MEILSFKIFIAFVLDLLFGDPYWLPHPVKIIGKIIESLELFLRKKIVNERWGGAILALVVIIGTYGTTYLIIKVTYAIGFQLAFAIEVFLIYTCLSTKSLAREASKIYHSLKEKNISKAKQQLSMIVGRDTQHLEEREIIRGTIETVSENIVDGIISPLFYAFIGGAPLAMTYKAINTLDSMIGYKNKRYLQFGWLSAKIDDWANFIPARIGGYLLPMAAAVIKQKGKESFKVMLRDGHKNPSPNSGIPEACVAGALGIQLGGLSHYQGKPVQKPLIGNSTNRISLGHIKDSIRLMYITSFITIILFAGITVVF